MLSGGGGVVLSESRSLKQNPNERLAIDHQALTTCTSLRLNGQMSIDSWRRVGRQISLVHNSSTWWMGDWLIYGESKYPDRYRRALADSFLDYQTLRNYAWVTRRFAANRRRPDLSFQHHAEVASLDEAEQDRWLDMAARNNWSKSRLRRELRSPLRAIKESHPVQLMLEIREDQRLRWEKAASEAKSDLKEWISAMLDAAASTVTDVSKIEIGKVSDIEADRAADSSSELKGGEPHED
jgi:hypothetical protein